MHLEVHTFIEGEGKLMRGGKYLGISLYVTENMRRDRERKKSPILFESQKDQSASTVYMAEIKSDCKHEIFIGCKCHDPSSKKFFAF